MWKLVLLVAFSLISVQARAVNGDEDRVFIKDLLFNGSGCSPDSTESFLEDVDQDGLPDQFGVLFNGAYTAQQGPGFTSADRRKNCTITLLLHIPQGFQYSVASVLYTGFADLPARITGRQTSAYRFPLASRRVNFDTTIRGAFTGNYERQDDVGISSVIWSPCGLDAPLSILTQVFLSGNIIPPASMTLDTVDGKVKQIYGLVWRPCLGQS
jgi:hypothetical protein